MARRKMNMVFACNAEGKIEGLVTKTDILNIGLKDSSIFKH